MRALREYCRLCLSTGCNLIDILEEDGDIEFAAKPAIEDLLQLLVVKEPMFPWMVCTICVGKLREFHLFKQRCVESQVVYVNRIRGNISTRKEVKSTIREYDDVAVKREEDVSIWDSQVQESHSPSVSNLFEVSRSTQGQDIEFDIFISHCNDHPQVISLEALLPPPPLHLLPPSSHQTTSDNISVTPIKTEGVDAVEEPLHHDYWKNVGGDHTAVSEDHSVNSRADDVRVHEHKNEPSDDEEDGTGSRVNSEDQEAFSQTSSLAGVESPPLLKKEETATDSCTTITADYTGSIQRQTGTARRGSRRGGRFSARRSMDQGVLSEAFVSNECSASFGSNTSLLAHTKCHQNSSKGRRVSGGSQGKKRDTEFPCPRCEQSFSTRGVLGCHVRKNHTGFSCDHCGKTWTQKLHLVKHIQSIHLKIHKLERKVPGRSLLLGVPAERQKEKREKLLICYHCNKGFVVKSKLLRHINSVHLGMKSSHCTICSKSFSSKYYLQDHMTCVHAEGRCFKCDVCGKAVKAARHLKAHLLQHEERLPFQCTLCPKSFVERRYLKNHMDSHSGRKHICKFCAKEFMEAGKLRFHMQRMHSDKRSHKCEICAKGFMEAELLRCHMRRMHLLKKMHKCEQCPKMFKTRTHLERHSVVHTGLYKYPCGVCSRKFYYSGQLNAHMKTHEEERPSEHGHENVPTSGNGQVTQSKKRMYKCHPCSQQFQTVEEMRKHVDGHSSDVAEKWRFKCDECSRVFLTKSSLRYHRATHTGLKAHVCKVCSMAFVERGQLKRHLETHNDNREVLSCKECSMTTSSKYYMRKHMKMVHGKDKDEFAAVEEEMKQ